MESDDDGLLQQQWEMLRDGTLIFPGARPRDVLGERVKPPTFIQQQVKKLGGAATARVDWPRRKLLWWDRVNHREVEQGSRKTKKVLQRF